MKKGFTLIELMAVIIILGVVAIISVPLIDNIIKDSKNNAYDSQITMILDASKKMVVEQPSLLPNEEDSSCIPLDDILQKGYLSSKKLVDPRNDEAMNGSVVVTYDSEYNKYRYEYQENSCE